MKRFREMEEDDVSMTNCLLLLGMTGEKRDDPPPRVFECKTRNRQFPSFQALGGHRASHKNSQAAHNINTKRLNNRISELEIIGYVDTDGTELTEVKSIWRRISRLKDAEMKAVVPHFRSMLRSFINDDNGIQPTTLSDRRLRNYCRTLLSKLVGDRIQGSAGLGREHRGIRGTEMCCSIVGLPVYYSAGQASSSRRTTDTGSMLMRDGRRHDQDPKMKEFRNFTYWAITLFIGILVGLLSANKRQSELLFKSCSSLVFGSTLLSLVMLVILSTGQSSQRALTGLMIMQYLILGLLVIAAILVFLLVWSN